MLKTYLIFWAKAFFFLTGTFLHELTHLIAAKILQARVTGFSIIPHLVRDFKSGRNLGGQYGYVDFHPKIQGLNFIIGLAPISLWVALWYILNYTQIIVPGENSFRINWENLFNPSSFWIWFTIIQLFRSGFPSSVDIKLSYFGLFSPSGIFLLLLLCFAYANFDVIYSYWDEVLGFSSKILYPLGEELLGWAKEALSRVLPEGSYFR